MELTDANLTLFLEDFRDKLQSLGDADSIATHLSGQQIVAHCASPGRCAIAVVLRSALTEEFGGAAPMNVCVGAGIFQVVTKAEEAVVAYSSREHRGPISRFISRFDLGMYPELVDTAVDTDGCIRVEHWNAMSDQRRAEMRDIYPA